MPAFTVKEVRWPELHLPEIKREEIIRSLSGVRLPEVDLARARGAKVRIPAVDLSSEQIGKLVAVAAVVARFMRPVSRRLPWPALPFAGRSSSPIARIVRPRPSRSRWLLAFGGIVIAALAAWAVLSRPAVRERLGEAMRAARERLDEFRADREGQLDVDADEPVALTGAETTSIEALGSANAADDAGTGASATDDPLGSGTNPNDADGVSTFAESGRPD